MNQLKKLFVENHLKNLVFIQIKLFIIHLNHGIYDLFIYKYFEKICVKMFKTHTLFRKIKNKIACLRPLNFIDKNIRYSLTKLPDFMRLPNRIKYEFAIRRIALELFDYFVFFIISLV